MRDDTERVPGAQEEAGQRERERADQHQPERHLVTRDGNLSLQHRRIGELRALYAARNTEEAKFLNRLQHVIGPIFHLHGQLGAAAGRNDGRRKPLGGLLFGGDREVRAQHALEVLTCVDRVNLDCRRVECLQ